ncbi:MAG: TetR/AcrR family transcriptional regulator [Actinobacteria bacterium]|nr:TetR/AcrR family transcriptional regulator [Actinomycetota bacterium]
MRQRTAEPTKREVIVESALRLILKKGYDGTTVDEVAQLSGVSKGLVSYHYPKKENLFRAVLEKIVGKLEGELKEVYESDASARERLRLNFRNLFDSEERTRHYYIVLVDFLAQAPREACVRNYTRVIYQTVLRYVEMTIADGVRSGEFRPVDVKLEAATIVALTEGFVFQWLFNPDGVTLEQAYQVSDDHMTRYLLSEASA